MQLVSNKVFSLFIALCDEMKINTFQLQLQMERSIEATERKMEIKIEELLTKIDQPLKNINGDINNL